RSCWAWWACRAGSACWTRWSWTSPGSVLFFGLGFLATAHRVAQQAEEGPVEQGRLAGPDRAFGQEQGLAVDGFDAGRGEFGVVEVDQALDQRAAVVQDQAGSRADGAQRAEDAGPQVVAVGGGFGLGVGPGPL